MLVLSDLCELVQGRRSHYLAQGSDGNEVWWQAICMLAGVACLNAFIQSNVTGPPLEEDWSAFLPADLRGDTEVCRRVTVMYTRRGLVEAHLYGTYR